MPAADSSLAHLARSEALTATPSGLHAALINSTDGAIVTTSLDGLILSWGAASERIYGFTAREALGKPLSLIVPADRAGEIIGWLHTVASGRRIGPIETVRIRRDKTRIDVSTALSPVYDSEDQVVAALAVERDISVSKLIGQSLDETRDALADSLAFLDKAERLSQTGTWTLRFGAEWSMVCSPESYRVLGIDDDTVMSVDGFFSFVHPDDREHVSIAMETALSEHRSYETEYRMVCTDQSIRWVHAWAEPEYDDNGEPLRVLGVVQDITDSHLAGEALRASEQRFRLLAENARDLIFRFAVLPAPRFEYVSPASTAITGYTPDELYADPSLASALVTPEALLQLESIADNGVVPEPVDLAIRRTDGSLVWVSHRLTLVHDASGALVAIEGIVRDVTERKRDEEARVYAGLHDALTGLPNRLLLRERLDHLRTRAATDGRSVVVASLDLDDFTLVNDTHGHETGDAVLLAVADLLTVSAGADATVARTGSDEFVIISDDAAGVDAAAALVERVRSAMLRPISVDGVEFFVHARMGVAVDHPSASCESLLRHAEIALARAKRRRAGTGVEFFNSEMRTRANERVSMVRDLHHAVERNEFALLYQPIVGLADEQVIGAEALLRWRHPQRGMVSPADFIPLAEDTGLILEIGAWALDEACTRLRDWSEAGPELAELGISVNLSVKQLRSAGIVSTVADAVTRAGIDPARLTVEMTESMVADDRDTVREVLTQLRKLGVRTAIDDFGTGYSSLSYLKYLPLDTLKIDQTFIEGLGSDPRDAAIVASTIAVSQALGLFTVAEGVETPMQLAALRALGCDAAQGFLFSEPLTGTQFTDSKRHAPAPIAHDD
jgi:diguanylate cyclase (GGDEF)-like protein/PAS domain S-box-containing protein